MFLRLIAIILILPIGAVLTGCKCPSGGCVPGTPCLPCANQWAEVDVEPPDLVELGWEEDELAALPAPTETFQLLDASACQCMAATNAPVANMVELERHWAKIVIECDTKAVQKNFCLDRDLLALHASGIRNESAGAALEAFYQLAGLEAQQHFLQLALEEASHTLDRINNLRSEGIELPEGIDYGAVKTQVQELKDQQLQMQFTRIQLNGQLQKLIGCPLDEHTFYWPQVQWQVDQTPIDVDAELAEGLATRTDLRGLQLLLCKMDRITLPVARAVLAYADGTVGSVEPRNGLRHVIRCCQCNKSEVPIRCRQLALFYSDTENLATAEIKNAAYSISVQQQRAANARESVVKLRERVRELTEMREVGDVAIFEISKARGDLYKAETKLIEQVVALEVAKVKLKQTQGLLSIECGFNPRLCCEGCCDGACCRCQKKYKNKQCSCRAE